MVAFELHEAGDRPARGADGELLQKFADLVEQHDDGALHVLSGGERAHGGDEHQQVFIEQYPEVNAVAEGADEVARNACDDRPARRAEGGEKEPEGDPLKPAQKVQNERGKEERGGDGDRDDLLYVPFLLLRRVPVHDLHLLKGGNVPDGCGERLLALMFERDALPDEIHAHIVDALERGELLLKFRRARRAVQITDLDDLFHTHSLKRTVEVLARERKHRDDVRIGERIDDILSVPPRTDDVPLAQNAELMGDGALRAPHRARDMVDAHLPLPQRKQNFQPARLGDGFERRRKREDALVVRHTLARPLRKVVMQRFMFAILHTLLLDISI